MNLLKLEIIFNGAQHGTFQRASYIHVYIKHAIVNLMK